MIERSAQVIEHTVSARIVSRLTKALAAPAGDYRPLHVDDRIVGWLDAARAARLAMCNDVFALRDGTIRFVDRIATPQARSEAIARVCRMLADENRLTAWRDELYAVGVAFGEPPRFLLERAAARFFGIQTYAMHVNGLVRADSGETMMWLARRSPTKSIDPGMLDNLVGGGVAAGTTVRQTLIKESWEEAGIALSLAIDSMPAGAVHICREQPDGLQRESILVHDLLLPYDFVPMPRDDEVVEHRLVSSIDVADAIANETGNDVVTADASLVILDCLLRRGALQPDSPHYFALEALRHPHVPQLTA